MNGDRTHRLFDLLADQTTGGLDAASGRELESLLADHPTGQDDSMELAAASVELAFLETGGEIEAMPAHLRARVMQDAERAMGWTAGDAAGAITRPRSADSVADRAADGGSFWSRWLPWTVAAASLVLVLWMFSRQPEVPIAEVPPSNADLRADLLVRDPAAVQLEWTATEDAAAADASGNVVWSDTEQAGYMIFRGLASNDPTAQQYQLWIFDETRDERYPVDGGVFDVPPGATEVVVPIQAKLDVDNPVLFAVTVERPGGVVVSSRERIVLVAQPS